MKIFKVLCIMSMALMSCEQLYSKVIIGEKTRMFAQQNAESIAKQFVTQYSDKIIISEGELQAFIDEDIYNSFSNNGVQFVLGFTQAEIDHGISNFISKSEISRETAVPVDQIRKWVQKNQGKIVNYLNNNRVRKAGFKAIEEACQALNIKLPQGDLSDQEKKDIAEEITIAIELANPDTDKSFGKKYFSKKQNEYIANYLIPQLRAAGYRSVSIEEFEKFLDKLPKKSHTGVSVENTFAKLARHSKKDFVDVISNTLAEAMMQQKQILNIAETLRAIKNSMAEEENAR